MNNPIPLAETPGAVYAVAYWLGILIFVFVNRKKIQIGPLIGVSLIFLVALVALMTINHPVPQALFIPSILLYVLVMWFMMYISIDVPKRSVTYYTARAFIVGEFIGSLSWQLYHFYVTTGYLANKLWIFILFIAFCEILSFFILLGLERKFKEEYRDIDFTRRNLYATILIVIAIFLASNLSYLNGNTPFSSTIDDEIFNVRTLIDFGGVTILFAFHIQMAELHMKLEVGKLQNLLKLQAGNYELSKDSVEMVNQKYHDLKHHIAVMRANAVDSESIDYLDQMEKDIKAYEAQNKTGNKVLDTILTVKSLTCQMNNSQLSVIADGRLLSMLDPIDISTLFGNILDNAIESVKEISDTDKRLIHLNVLKQKQFILIRIENPYIGQIEYKNGLPITTKEDQINHGYGLKSVFNVVEKYHGSLTISNDKNWFEVRILIPIQPQ